ncbi:MAG: hypothetical protein AB1896_21215, partial [Thermodesulfobacteriota bacterium]
MIRARLWFRCAAVLDPVAPVLIGPARLGWEAKARRVDLVIERGFTGEELLRRQKGWITADPERVIEAVRPHGRLKVLDDRLLVVEFEDQAAFLALQKELAEKF